MIDLGRFFFLNNFFRCFNNWLGLFDRFLSTLAFLGWLWFCFFTWSCGWFLCRCLFSGCSSCWKLRNWLINFYMCFIYDLKYLFDLFNFFALLGNSLGCWWLLFYSALLGTSFGGWLACWFLDRFGGSVLLFRRSTSWRTLDLCLLRLFFGWSALRLRLNYSFVNHIVFALHLYQRFNYWLVLGFLCNLLVFKDTFSFFLGAFSFFSVNDFKVISYWLRVFFLSGFFSRVIYWLVNFFWLCVFFWGRRILFLVVWQLIFNLRGLTIAFVVVAVGVFFFAITIHVIVFLIIGFFALVLTSF